MSDSSLSTKIAKASLEVGTFTADKNNKEQNYKYISADQVLDRCGKALSNVGVVVIPTILDSGVNITERQGKTPRIDATVAYEMIVTDGEKEIKAAWVGYGSDYATPDKAIYKAITSGHKYFLMKLLNIGIGNEDGEHEAEKPELITDDAWKKWIILTNRAKAAGVEAATIDRSRSNLVELREAYAELKDIVDNAEQQEKA